MRVSSRAVQLLIATLAVATAGRRSLAAQSGFARVVAPTPPGIAPVLQVDSTIAVAATPTATPTTGAVGNGCAYALRDPRSRTRFLLSESQRVTSTDSIVGARPVTTERAEANYLPVGSGALRLPPGRYLRVDCRGNRVLGLATSLKQAPNEVVEKGGAREP